MDSSADFPSLLQALERSDPLVSSADLAGTRLNDGQVQKLAAALSTNTVVTVVNLSGCGIKDSGARLLSNVVRNNRTLQQVSLSDNSITDEGSRLFCDAMQFQSSIMFLDLSYNDITSEGARHLGVMLRSNSTLGTLVLSCNQLGNEGVRVLCRALKDNPDTPLHDLLLDNNAISDASELADLLKTVASIRVLELQDNHLGDAGSKDLAEALKVTRLTSINLANNKITDDGLCVLAIGVAMNKGELSKVDLRRNKCQQRGERALQGAQMRKPTMMLIWREDQVMAGGAEAGAASAEQAEEAVEFPAVAGAEWISRDPVKRLSQVLAPGDNIAFNTDTFIAATDPYVQLLRQALSQFKRDAPLADLPPILVSLRSDVAVMVKYLQTEPPTVASPGAPALSTRFGMRRARIADLLVSCAELKMDTFDQALADTGAVGLIMDAFFTFPFNNILHAMVARLITCATAEDAPKLTEALVATGILDRIIETEAAARDARVRPGHMGHVVAIANILQESSLPALRAATEGNAKWKAFVAAELAELNKRNSAILGDVPPQRPPVIEGGEARSLMGLSNLFQALGFNFPGFSRG